MKILNSKSNKFYSELNKILDKRKKIDRLTLKRVEKIINDVRKYKDKELIRLERKFNNNNYHSSIILIINRQSSSNHSFLIIFSHLSFLSPRLAFGLQV